MQMEIQRVHPIAEQVLALLRQRIRDRVYGPENRLPSESELADELQVSRATIRSALSALAAERLIVRRQGDGTYINRRFLDTTTHFGAISEFTGMIRSSGQEPSIRALEIYSREVRPKEMKALEVAPGSQVLVLVRLFFADGKPAIYSTNSIPEALVCHELHKSDIEEPLPSFFKKFCDQEFTYGISELFAENIPEEIARPLGVDASIPLVGMHEVFYNDRDEPLVFAVNYFNRNVFQLKVARSFD
jgi:GntR family transcriptional regulator